MQVAGKKGNGTVFRRPLTLLALLEIAFKESVTHEKQINTPIAPVKQAERPISRSRRVAATIESILEETICSYST